MKVLINFKHTLKYIMIFLSSSSHICNVPYFYTLINKQILTYFICVSNKRELSPDNLFIYFNLYTSVFDLILL